MKTLRYETRDANGNDIVKDVVVKEFASVAAEFKCPVCGKDCHEGVRTAVKRAMPRYFPILVII